MPETEIPPFYGGIFIGLGLSLPFALLGDRLSLSEDAPCLVSTVRFTEYLLFILQSVFTKNSPFYRDVRKQKSYNAKKKDRIKK